MRAITVLALCSGVGAFATPRFAVAASSHRSAVVHMEEKENAFALPPLPSIQSLLFVLIGGQSAYNLAVDLVPSLIAGGTPYPSVVLNAGFLGWAVYNVALQLRIFNGDSVVVLGTEQMMSQKEFGTSAVPVQKKLRWTCDEVVAEKICNYNRHSAEFAGYWERASTFLQEESEASGEITFYDSNTGMPLFYGPRERSFSDFVSESKKHGWPSFRDSEVNWDYVRVLPNGECISVDGTHLGHNLPDWNGNRYCAPAPNSAAQPWLRTHSCCSHVATRARGVQASISSRSRAGRSVEMRCGQYWWRPRRPYVHPMIHRTQPLVLVPVTKSPWGQSLVNNNIASQLPES